MELDKLAILSKLQYEEEKLEKSKNKTNKGKPRSNRRDSEILEDIITGNL